MWRAILIVILATLALLAFLKADFRLWTALSAGSLIGGILYDRKKSYREDSGLILLSVVVLVLVIMAITIYAGFRVGAVPLSVAFALGNAIMCVLGASLSNLSKHAKRKKLA